MFKRILDRCLNICCLWILKLIQLTPLYLVFVSLTVTIMAACRIWFFTELLVVRTKKFYCEKIC